MRIARFELDGAPSFGIVDGDEVQPVTGTLPFDGPLDPSGPPLPLGEVRLLAPTDPVKVLCIGRNYAAHAAEIQKQVGPVPSVFLKPPNAIVPHGGTVVLPPEELSTHVEHEAELAVVIGAVARSVPKEDALRYVLGYTCADDVSARDLQRSDPQLTRGKGFDTFCPLGPFIETEVELDGGLGVRCRVNGELRQDGNTSDMLFDVPTLIEHLSAWTTLLPGDVILTGSPSNTGPLAPGDEVEIAVERVGTLVHGVAAAS